MRLVRGILHQREAVFGKQQCAENAQERKHSERGSVLSWYQQKVYTIKGQILVVSTYESPPNGCVSEPFLVMVSLKMNKLTSNGREIHKIIIPYLTRKEPSNSNGRKAKKADRS